MRGEILQSTEWRGLAGITGTADGTEVEGANRLDAKALSKGRASLADCYIDAVGTEIRQIFAGDRLKIDGGMITREAAQARHQPFRCEGRRDAERYTRGLWPQGPRRVVDDGERAANGAVIAAADLG